MSESQRRAGDAGAGGMDWGRIWPCREEFLELARTRRVIPVVERLLVDPRASSPRGRAPR